MLNEKNTIYFDADEWSFNQDVQTNRGEKCFVTGVKGDLCKAWSLSNWSWDWTEILTKPLPLDKQTTYSLVFWAKSAIATHIGNSGSTLQVEVLFDGDYENRLIFKLDEAFIQPVKKCKGWSLFELGFTTGINNLTEIRFVAQRCPVVIMPALEKECYDDLEDDVDDAKNYAHNKNEQIVNYLKDMLLESIRDELIDGIKEELMDEFDIGYIRDEVKYELMGELDVDGIRDGVKDEIMGELDLEDLKEEIKNEILSELDD